MCHVTERMWNWFHGPDSELSKLASTVTGSESSKESKYILDVVEWGIYSINVQPTDLLHYVMQSCLHESKYQRNVVESMLWETEAALEAKGGSYPVLIITLW